MGEKHPYYGKIMSISFPDFPHTMGFVAFSRSVGNLWGNPCIFHMMPSVIFSLCIIFMQKNLKIIVYKHINNFKKHTDLFL